MPVFALSSNTSKVIIPQSLNNSETLREMTVVEAGDYKDVEVRPVSMGFFLKDYSATPRATDSRTSNLTTGNKTFPLVKLMIDEEIKMYDKEIAEMMSQWDEYGTMRPNERIVSIMKQLMDNRLGNDVANILINGDTTLNDATSLSQKLNKINGILKLIANSTDATRITATGAFDKDNVWDRATALFSKANQAQLRLANPLIDRVLLVSRNVYEAFYQYERSRATTQSISQVAAPAILQTSIGEVRLKKIVEFPDNVMILTIGNGGGSRIDAKSIQSINDINTGVQGNFGYGCVVDPSLTKFRLVQEVESDEAFFFRANIGFGPIILDEKNIIYTKI